MARRAMVKRYSERSGMDGFVKRLHGRGVICKKGIDTRD
jgi:hypothetical protein